MTSFIGPSCHRSAWTRNDSFHILWNSFRVLFPRWWDLSRIYGHVECIHFCDRQDIIRYTIKQQLMIILSRDLVWMGKITASVIDRTSLYVFCIFSDMVYLEFVGGLVLICHSEKCKMCCRNRGPNSNSMESSACCYSIAVHQIATHFAHVTRAELSSHVQNLVAITLI